MAIAEIYEGSVIDLEKVNKQMNKQIYVHVITNTVYRCYISLWYVTISLIAMVLVFWTSEY